MLKFIAFIVLTVSWSINSVNCDACSAANCLAPGCLCLNTLAPYGMAPTDIPQMIHLVFEGSLSVGSYPYYKNVLTATNPNGCPISGTFFLDHEYTDYTTVRQVWLDGHDINIQSITDVPFSGKTSDIIYNEIYGEIYYANRFSLLDTAVFQGERAPQTVAAGDSQFQAIQQSGLLFDSSLVTRQYSYPYWPYTLDFPTTQDCNGQCPTGTYPGLWEFPITDMFDGNKQLCSNVQQCIYNNTITNAYDLLIQNLQAHIDQKVPYLIPVPLAWLYDGNNTQFLNKFLTEATTNGSYIISINRALSWFQTPTTVADIASFEPWLCDTTRTVPNCNAFSCTYNFSSQAVTMNYCSSAAQPSCPTSYPWVDNLPF